MSSENMDIEYAEDPCGLVSALSALRRPGAYFAYGEEEVPMPNLRFGDAAPISFPVPDTQLHNLLSFADKAPFGRGTETILDESVRKVWQIPPERFHLSGKGWNAFLERGLDTIRDALGCQGTEIRAELYKLLIYSEGGHFAAHRDTEKAEGMFGTWVISLPCVHTGGNLLVRHAGEEVRLDLCPQESAEVRYAAFFADCEHEVEPVTSGYRVCLVYNLIRNSGAHPESPGDERKTIRAAVAALREWQKAPGRPEGDSPKIVYLLSHMYTEASLSFAQLKGEDRTLARVLCAAARETNIEIYLAMVHLSEFGYFEGCYGYDDEPDEMDLDDAVPEEMSAELRTWRDPEDRCVNYGSLSFDPKEDLLPPGELDDEEPDDINFHGNTGNEGASYDRAYLRAALVLWPRRSANAILLARGRSTSVGRLAYCADRGVADETERGELMELADAVLDTAPGVWTSEEVQGFCGAVLTLGFSEQLEGFWRRAVLEGFDGEWNEALARSFALLPEKTSLDVLRVLVERYADLLVVDTLDLLARIIMAHPVRLSALRPLLLDLCGRIPKAKQGAVYRGGGYEDFRNRMSQPPEEFMFGASQHKPASLCLAPETLLQALTILEREGFYEDAVRLIEALRQNPAIFAPDLLLFTAWRTAMESAASGRVPGLLWQATAGFLLERSEVPPEPPKDWSDATPVNGRGSHVVFLREFLQDPHAETRPYRANQGDRQQIASLIYHQRLDIDCRTEEKGRPYTLHLTKNRAAFKRAVETHRADLVKMRDLLCLGSPPDDPTSAQLAARLRHTTA